jgi:hypothetical protein
MTFFRKPKTDGVNDDLVVSFKSEALASFAIDLIVDVALPMVAISCTILVKIIVSESSHAGTLPLEIVFGYDFGFFPLQKRCYC